MRGEKIEWGSFRRNASTNTNTNSTNNSSSNVSTSNTDGVFVSKYRRSVREGLEKSTTNYSKVNSIITEILCSQGSCPIF